MPTPPGIPAPSLPGIGIAPPGGATSPGGAGMPAGGFVTLDGEEYYRIAGCHRLPPFLMSLASDTDLWMFVASGGGLTAGRVDADGALFPYETVDRLHDGHHHTGPITLVRVRRGGAPEELWQPFAEAAADDPRIERNLYKNVVGTRLVFEEIRHDLGLAFRYRWAGCDEFGWVRTARLANRGAATAAVSLLDGLRNVLPWGAPLALYQQSSSLVDAYKRTDCDPETRLGSFSLTSRIIDRPEASEALRANAVWCHGPASFDVCLSLDAVAAFRRGEALAGEATLTGRRGNYLVVSSLELAPGAAAEWHLAADAGLSHIQLAARRARLLAGGAIGAEIAEALRRASASLTRIVAATDGLQLTGHAEATAHHFANVLFNDLRGGVFADDYRLPRADLVDFLRTRNRAVAERHAALLAALPAEIPAEGLRAAAAATGDADLERLSYEYLPLYFGRRHGDPSRPWNRFTIHVRNRDGSRALRYEGNWRDLFQNWEALGLSFPGFLPGFIARFVDASTVDGFNPYHLTRDGFDWEVADPDDPWNHIGYWGDHQIVYLLKLLEAQARTAPGTLEELLGREIFSYADVPYRLKPYREILAAPRTSIVYDTERAARLAERVAALGSDGKLVAGPDGAVWRVGLLEKLLVPALSKLSNLVPDGGVWMNTQRPEWNDANNALAGHGLSVVTLCYLRRYLGFLERLLADRADATVALSTEVAAWLRRVSAILAAARPRLAVPALDDRERKRLLDELGEAFSEYRAAVYAGGFSGKETVAVAEAVDLCRAALAHLDHAIAANRRADGLYHSYNLLAVGPDGGTAAVQPLAEMLEGQVAALSSGVVDAPEAVELVERLFASRLYRADQRSFLLYPERELPAFLEKNAIPAARVAAVPLLRELVAAGDVSLLARDASGTHRFAADFRNALDLHAALAALARQERWAARVAADGAAVLEVFEAVFRHRAFTGRSGAMYAYEGLGCVYWHMVAKLLLAIQEIALRAAREGQPAAVRQALARAYYRVRSGLGFEKTVAEYGAFPTDPYSHTPPHAGAQQPGMTGQVKEEILTRFGELGVEVEDGTVRFRPALLRRAEFLAAPGVYRCYDLGGALREIPVPRGGLAFSFCQTPVVYALSPDAPWVRVTAADGAVATLAGDRLDAAASRSLFERRAEIACLEVGVREDSLCSF